MAEGNYYVVGDNRDNSRDSRHFGLVPASYVRGRAMLIYFSRGPGGMRWERVNQPVH